MTFYRRLAGISVVLLVAAACSSSASPSTSTAPSVAAASVAAAVTPSPAPAATPTAAPTSTPAPTAPPPTADVTITAEGIAFTTPAVTAAAGKPFTIAFQNNAAGIPHNVHISTAAGANVFKGDLVTGAKTIVYNVPAIKAGTYPFVCDVHPEMKGAITVS
jgi:plastocyanin